MAQRLYRPVVGKIIGTPYAGTHTLGNWESDRAIDIAAKMGTPIYSPFAGTIGQQFGALGSSDPRFAGLRLHVLGPSDEAYLAHLSRFAPGIKPGAEVSADQLLGYSGEASGVGHLHFALENENPLAFYGSASAPGSGAPMALGNQSPLAVIKNYAPTVGLDPAAVVAYALTQGGTSWGAVGDQGTSFGPFQAHIGGAAGNRSPQDASAWANSPQGLTAMMNMMAHAGAKGRRGPEAAAYIVGPSFGRGANPASDEAKARAAYAQAARLVGSAQAAGPAAMAPGPAQPGLSAVSEQLIGPGYAYVKGSPPGSLAAVQRPVAAAQPAPKTLSFGPARPSASGAGLPSSVTAALKALGR